MHVQIVTEGEVERVTQGFLSREPWATSSDRFLRIVLEKLHLLNMLHGAEQGESPNLALEKALSRLYTVSILRTIELLLSSNGVEQETLLQGFHETFSVPDKRSFMETCDDEGNVDFFERSKDPEEKEHGEFHDAEQVDEVYEPFDEANAGTRCFRHADAKTSEQNEIDAAKAVNHLVLMLRRQVFTFAEYGMLRDGRVLGALTDCCETLRSSLSENKETRYMARSITEFVCDCIVADPGCLGKAVKSLFNGFGIYAETPPEQPISHYDICAISSICLQTIGSIYASFKYVPNPPNRQLWHTIYQYHLLHLAGATLEHSLQNKFVAIKDADDTALHAAVVLIEFCATRPPPMSLRQSLYDLLLASGALRSLTRVFIHKGADPGAVATRHTMLFVCAASPQSYAWSKLVPGFEETWESAASLGEDLATMLYFAMTKSPKLKQGDTELAQHLRSFADSIGIQYARASGTDVEIDKIWRVLVSLERTLSLMTALQNSGEHGISLWGPETRDTLRGEVAKRLKECHSLINTANDASHTKDTSHRSSLESLEPADGKVGQSATFSAASRISGILRECSRLVKELQLEGSAAGKSD